jgi:hypothetical protein
MKLPIGSLELLLRAVRKVISSFGPYSISFEELSNRLVIATKWTEESKMRGS